MKEIKIFVTEEQYQRINNIANWLNMRSLLVNNDKSKSRDVESFIKGATITILEQIENINPASSTSLRSETKFRNNFKKIAKERNIRQVDICTQLGIEKSYLSMIFNNKSQPGSELFFKIWVLLKFPPIHKTFYFED